MPDVTDTQTATEIESGETVYDEDGQIVGTVCESTAEGFAVDTVDGVQTVEESFDPDEELPGQEFGEGYLMWRCEECGEMGELEDGFPEQCPACAASSEHVVKALED